MPSTISYKFRASTSYETISMPGSSARLFDVKRAIVKAKKLDRSTGGSMQLEFDLSVKNAMTNEEYDDENMLLPRGTRVILQRMPAIKGQGLLARIARADAGITGTAAGTGMRYGNVAAAESGFYTVQSHKEEEEFVDTRTVNANVQADGAGEGASAGATEDTPTEEDELAALKAVTDQAGSIYRLNTTISRSAQPSKFAGGVAGGGISQPSTAPFQHQGGGGAGGHHQHHNNRSSYQPRPNADPELRDQELRMQQQTQPKKRATGIPRTFLNPYTNIGTKTADESNDNADNNRDTGIGIKLKTNALGLEALIKRGGGQSTSGSGIKRRDIDYALKLTATEIPEHLQCGICAQIVKNAMLVPWDTDGHTVCEVCMRDGLAKNAFKCPLTGVEGKSPDDLFPNYSLRKVAEAFEKEVLKKMDEIIQLQELEDEQERKKAAEEALLNDYTSSSKKDDLQEVDTMERGVVTNRRGGFGSVHLSKSRRQSDDFGADDVFGGDVFDVDNELEEPDEDQPFDEQKKELNENESNLSAVTTEAKNRAAQPQASIDDNSKKTIAGTGIDAEKKQDMSESRAENRDGSNGSHNTDEKIMSKNAPSTSNNANSSSAGDTEMTTGVEGNNSNDKQQTSSSSGSTQHATNRRELLKNRAPPAGYVMGPAGAGGSGNQHHRQHTSYNGGRGGYYHQNSNNHNYQGRGGNGYGGRGRFQRHQNYNNQGRGFRGGSGRGGEFHQYHQQEDQNFPEVGNAGSGDSNERPSKRPHGEIDDQGSASSQEQRSNQGMGWHHGGRADYVRGGGDPGFENGGRFGGRGRGDFHYGGRGRGGRGYHRGGGRGRGWDNGYGGRGRHGRGRFGGRTY